MILTLTRTQFENAKARLLVEGITILEDQGTLVHDGITISYQYVDPVLTVLTLKKPFYVPESSIEDHITKWFAQPV